MTIVTYGILTLLLCVGAPEEGPVEIEQDDDDLVAGESLPAKEGEDGEVSYERALEQLRIGVTIGDEKPTEAISVLEGALAVLPSFTPQLAADPEALALRAEAYVSLARAYLTIREDGKARAALDEGARVTAPGQTLPVERYGPRVEKVWKAKLKAGQSSLQDVKVKCWVSCRIFVNERVVAPLDLAASDSEDEYATRARLTGLTDGSYRLWIEAEDGSVETMVTEFAGPKSEDAPLEFIFGTKPEPPPPEVTTPVGPVEILELVEPPPERPKRLLPRPVAISMAAAGLGLIASGAVLFVIDGKCANPSTKGALPADGAEVCPRLWTTGIAGIALMGSGAGLFGLGAAFITVDEVRTAKQGRSARINVGWSLRF
ncbi:MAG: hypothetical protein KC431_31765 [Myxococcales bacterium]|nr:hypothetical protein [Myxococcales bacterium]